MAVSKTRQHLVDVARQLFAKNGVQNTTMNDIAVASQKGRRTLYTYFQSKEDVYFAVIESELELLSETMRKVAAKNISVDEKILELVYTHLDAIKEVVYRNGTLRAVFFRDIWKVEHARKNFDNTEIEIFRYILLEASRAGVFRLDEASVPVYADILHYCVKGIEVPYIRGRIGDGLDREVVKHYVRRIVFGAFERGR